MNTPGYGKPAIYRPEEGVRNLIALASERLDFYAQQAAVLDEALAIIIHEHAQLIEFYRSQIEVERVNIERLSRFLGGEPMSYPEVQAAPPAQLASPDPAPFNGEMSITPDELREVMERRAAMAAKAGEQKQAILRTMNAEDDRPQESLGGRSRREVVEQAVPLPQMAVSVVEYADGEELPPEAKPGHLSTEPRSAEELAKQQAPRGDITSAPEASS